MMENGKRMCNGIMMPGKEVLTLYPQQYLRNRQTTLKCLSQMYYQQMADAGEVTWYFCLEKGN